MDSVAISAYPAPLDRLLTLGDCRGRRWPDYRSMGFRAEHVPDLIRMSLDSELNWADSDSDEVWAPIHAWRTLGLLRATEAVEPLLTLLDELEDSDWLGEELPTVFAMIGPAAIPPLVRYLEDRSHGTSGRITVAACLEKIGSRRAEVRDECVSALVRALEGAAGEESDFNGFIISYLVDLKAVEAAPVIERAFVADLVDLSVMGDWEEVQVELGLLPERITPPRQWLVLPGIPSFVELREREARRRRDAALREAQSLASARAKAAAKRKQEKRARRKNRRRK